MINLMKSILRRRVVGLLALAVATGAASSAAAGVVHDSHVTAAGQEVPAVAAPPKVARITPAQQSLGVLRRTPLGAADRLPDQAQSTIAASSLSGENPALGRKALSAAYGSDVYVSPAAEDQVCVDFLNGGIPVSGTCAPVSLANRGGFNGAAACTAGVPDEDSVEFGMLPDGASDPRFVLSDGSEQPISVANNVYAIEMPRTAEPTSIEWTANGVRQSAQLTPAPSLRGGQCAR
jgi:hypothetical protein